MSDRFIDRVDEQIRNKSLLDHTFYQEWKSGSLNLDDLKIYAKQYYHFESNFPRFLSAIHSRCPDREVRQVVLGNLWDEEHGERNHRELWLDFCEGLGLSRTEVIDSVPYANTLALVNDYYEVCSNGSFLEGVASIYSYEAQLPEISTQKIEGLVKWYGISDSKSLEFFRIHAYLDLEHSQSESRLISDHTSYDTEHAVNHAIQVGLDAWYSFLDGINELRRNPVRA